MSDKEIEDIDIELEELEGTENTNKIGEVCCADTSGVIDLKILDRPDELKIGQPIVIDTDKYLYYCMINRLYHPSNPIAVRFANSPLTGLIPPSQIEGVRGKEFYGMADLSCLKIIPMQGGESQDILREFDTIPPIFSKGRAVTDEEIKIIYKTSEHSDSVGTLRGFKYDIPIDIEMLVKKPYGLFGRTGMGKSILNKILCLNILKHEVSQLLLFDMQGEYGSVSRADNSKGLYWYYPDKIKMYLLGQLDKKDKIIDGAEFFFIYKDNITSGDIIASAQNLPEPSINVLLFIERLVRKNKINYDNLIDAINNIDADDYKEINPFSLRALQNRIIPFGNYDFLRDRGERDKEDSLEDIFSKLIEGKSIVVDFGKFGTNMHLYFFIANSITRRLY